MSDYVCIKSRDEVIDGYLKKKSNGNVGENLIYTWARKNQIKSGCDKSGNLASNFNETGAKTLECVSAGQKPAEPNSTNILSMVTWPRKQREPPAVLTSSATSYICIKKLLCDSKGKLNFAWRVYISSYEEKDRFFFNSQQKRQTILYL